MVFQRDINQFKTLLHFIDGASEIWIKYRSYIRLKGIDLQRDQVLFTVSPGKVMVKSFTHRQRFYSNLMLTAASHDLLSSGKTNEKRITKIRDIIFIDSQLYVITPHGSVLKLKDDHGFIVLKVSDQEFRLILKQLKENENG